MRSNAKSAKASSGLLARLRRDTSGTTLAMAAAALLPIAAMIGSGLDMARAYTAQQKLQNACDAAALAARRFMAANAFSTGARDEGIRFFRFNFPDGTMDTAPVTLNVGASTTDVSVVEVSASTTVPTTIMALFGQEEMDIAVDCDADQDYVNNDIMLVLDVTLSMNCQAGDAGCLVRDTEHSTSRLRRLREGAAGIYRALADANGVRTRYGFMTYSSAVNVGRDLNQTWLRDPADYRQDTCSGSAVCYNLVAVDHTPSGSMTWFNNWRGGSTPSWTTNRNQGCVEERRTVGQSGNPMIRTDVVQNDIDVVSTSNVDRQFVPFDPVAQQAEINTYGIPTLDFFCPRPARRLATYSSESAFQAEINRLTGSQSYTGGPANQYDGRAAGGFTYHELGILWGARYLSSSGMFASSNPTTFNGIRVDKHIVFLTDGVQTSTLDAYTSYGVERYDRRLGGANDADSQVARHRARFLSACNRARQMGMTIWVIALDVQALDQIRPCATSADHFYTSNGSDLEQIFELIGRGIGRLRLTD